MSAEFDSWAARGRADRLLELRARRGAVRCAADLAPGRRRAPARAAPAARRLRADRLLGVARRGRARTSRSSALPKARATWSGSACSTACRRRARSASTALRLVYGAVAAVIGLQLIARRAAADHARAARSLQTGLMLRITRRRRAGPGPQSLRPGGAGEPVAHPLRDARPRARSGSTTSTSTPSPISARRARTRLVEWRGLAVALTAPLFALGARHEERLAHPAVARGDVPVALAARDLRLFRADGGPRHRASRHRRRLVGSAAWSALLAVMTVGAMVLLPSARARGWVKVKLAKHLFEHRYDYRTEWLRFTETLGRAGPDAPPLGERIVKAFADIVDAPGGLLLVGDGGAALAIAAPAGTGRRRTRPRSELDDAPDFWTRVESERPHPRVRGAARRLGAARRQGARRARAGCSTTRTPGPACR